MQKISSKDASALLKQAGSAIRDLTVENKSLHVKLAQRDRDARIVKMARDMESKGLMEETDLVEKVAHLQKVPNLDVTEEAIKLAAPQSSGFGGLGEADVGGEHPFVTYVATGEDIR